MTEQENPQDGAGDGEQPNQGRVFTQDEMNRTIADRLSRQAAQFADYDTLKAQAAELETIKTAQLSELEQARKAQADAESKAEAVMTSARLLRIQSRFETEAAKAGALHPEDAYALSDKAGVSVDGGVVSGAAEAVAALVAGGRLVMSGKPPAPNLNGGAGGGDRPGDGAVKLTAEEIQMAHNMHMTPEEYAKGKL